MPLLRFVVTFEGNPVLHPDHGVIHPERTAVGCRIHVEAPEGSGLESGTTEHDFSGERLKQALELHQAGSAFVEVTGEWLEKHSNTWREAIIDSALNQFAAPPFQAR
jgi:hypothetical protein